MLLRSHAHACASLLRMPSACRLPLLATHYNSAGKQRCLLSFSFEPLPRAFRNIALAHVLTTQSGLHDAPASFAINGAPQRRADSESGSYTVNWAHWRPAPYTWSAEDFSPIASRVNQVTYSFVYFCPPPGTSPMPYWAQAPYGSCSDSTAFTLMSVDTTDTQALQTLVSYKSGNPNLKVGISIGGWNFPSAFFSALAASATGRTTFAKSVASWVQQYQLDLVDIDWESPCSGPRTDPVEITCTQFQTVADTGGSCPNDTNNVVLLIKALKAALPANVGVTIAGQAARANELEMNVGALAPYLDHFNVMSYDYTVPDVSNPGVMSPNAPLYTPPAASNATQMSINTTVANYLAAGVPPSKIWVGIPMYGHSWYNANLAANNAWQAWGNTPQVQGMCCGPFQATYGGRPGQGASQCGVMMYSEIVAAAPQLTYYDKVTESNIAYMSAQGADGWTPAGTWITYNDIDSITAIVEYAASMGLGGIFVFDASMDTVAPGGGFTYKVMNAIADQLTKS